MTLDPTPTYVVHAEPQEGLDLDLLRAGCSSPASLDKLGVIRRTVVSSLLRPVITADHMHVARSGGVSPGAHYYSALKYHVHEVTPLGMGAGYIYSPGSGQLGRSFCFRLENHGFQGNTGDPPELHQCSDEGEVRP